MNSLLTSLVVWIGRKFIQLIGKTSSYQLVSHPRLQELKEQNKKVIYAFWHGRLFFLIWSHRRQNICILISQSKDGELIAKITESFGYQSVRGSSTRGGGRALVQLIRKTRAGYDLAFTPDGPRGPREKVQWGVLFVAQKTGLPIVPLTYGVQRKLVFKNWDEFYVPLPWSRVVVVQGEPFYIRPDDNLDVKAGELAEAINQITRQADKVVSVKNNHH